MTCVCGGAAERFMVPNPLTGEPMEMWRCSVGICQRELWTTTQGPRWMKSGLFCQDPECDAPTFRLLKHPVEGYLIRLWPRPEACVAWYRVEKPLHGGGPSQTPQYYCSTDCAPNLGDLPHHGIEAGGDPHPDEIGPCIALERAKARHMECFTEERGTFYRNWFNDHLHLPLEQVERLMAWWEQDRDA